MKKTSIALVILLLLAMVTSGALASVSATPNQKLAFRTGPNTKYVEVGTLPQSTSIRAIEYEEGNGVTWVLVEYTYNGERCRAYTGLKRMTVNGYIPWADHYNESWQADGYVSVYAAPSTQAAYRGSLYDGEWVTLLDWEGDYAFIEFMDGGTPSRGYVYSWDLRTYYDDYDYNDNSSYNYNVNLVDATPNQRLAFRTGPNTKYVELYTLSQSTPIKAIEYEEGNGVTWVLVEFTRDSQKVRAYTGLKRMSVNGYIPWADHLNWSCRVTSGGTVYAAPTDRGAYRGRLSYGDYVTLLRYEGDYAFIEFYDGNTPSRGYIESWRLD